MTQILTPCRRWYTCPSTDTCGGSSCPWWCSGLSCCSCCGCPSGWSNYCCLPSFHTMSCSTGQLGISYVAAAAFSLWNVSPQRSTSCHRTSWTKKGKLMTSTWKISDLSNNLRTEVCCVYPWCFSFSPVSDAPVSELSLELLLLQVVLPALLEQGHTRQWLKGLVRAWTVSAGYLL